MNPMQSPNTGAGGKGVGDKEKLFTLFWRDGHRDVLPGNSVSDAMTRAGYGVGAVAALDFYADGENTEYMWLKSKGWVRVDA